MAPHISTFSNVQISPHFLFVFKYTVFLLTHKGVNLVSNDFAKIFRKNIVLSAIIVNFTKKFSQTR